MKLKLLSLLILISGISLAQGKKEKAELLEQYAANWKVYDSISGEFAVLSDYQKTLAEACQKEQTVLSKSFGSALNVKRSVLVYYKKLEQKYPQPNGIRQEQLDSIHLYAITDVKMPDWSQSEIRIPTEKLSHIDWHKVDKKQQLDSLRSVNNRLQKVNEAIINQCNEIKLMNQEMIAISNRLKQLSELNRANESLLKGYESNFLKQLPEMQVDGALGNGNLLPPSSTEPQQEDNTIYDVVDEYAEFPAGIPAIKKYMETNIVYPESAEKVGIEGKVYLKFVVSKKGNISNVSVLRGVPDCPECDKEAVRVVKGMPQWTPGKINGKAVNSWFTLPVKFALPK